MPTSSSSPRGIAALKLRLTASIEYFIIKFLVPKRVGPVMRWIFKAPIFCYQIGLGSLMGKRILILTTVGRKSGKLRRTALEYDYDPANGSYLLMTGWGGKSDWYRNALMNSNVELWVGKKRFKANARSASVNEVEAVMQKLLHYYPRVVKTWESVTGLSYDGTPDSLSRMAASFPSLVVRQ